MMSLNAYEEYEIERMPKMHRMFVASLGKNTRFPSAQRVYPK